MNSLLLRRVWSWFLFLAVALLASSALAYIGNVTIQGPSPPGPLPGNTDGPSPGFITSTQFGDPMLPGNGCHLCHASGGTAPSTLQLTVAGVAQVLSPNPAALYTDPIATNFNVPVGSIDNNITLTITQDASTKPRAGFLLYHEVPTSSPPTFNLNGTLHTRPGFPEVTQCQVAPPDGAGPYTQTTCHATTGTNTEVMHTVPRAGSGNTFTFDFRYDAPAARCGTFQFRLWVNSVNDDQHCFNALDNSNYYRFTITTTCATGPNPCQACNNAAGGTCTAAAASGLTCRGAAGVCDAVETCNGSATTCPADGKLGGACADDGNVCTNDICDGVNDACQHPNNTANCGSGPGAGGPCDAQDTCAGGACVDHKVANLTVCPSGADANVCTDDICNGVSNACQHPVIVNPTAFQCRASGGACDPADFCTVGGACPDVKSSAVCRASTDAACDPAESCDGITNACPADVKLNNVACTADVNVCTRDVCLTGVCSHPADMGGTACGAATTCTSPSILQPGGICVNGTVGCTTPAPITCTSVCTAGSCSGVCTTDAQCNPSFFCNSANTCQHKDYGAACPASDCLVAGCRQCDVLGNGNNFCVDGFCCNSACGGGSATDCQSCNASVGLRGTCSPQTGTSCSDNSQCTTGETCNAGTCGAPVSTVTCTALDACHVAGICNPANGVCSNPNAAPGTPCGVPVCQDQFTRIPTSACDASGVCQPGAPVSCAPNKCAAGACTTGCTADTDCGAGAYCDTLVVGGQCKPKLGNGGACVAGWNNSCTSNHCVDGFCCNSDCTGQCEACNVPTVQGTCSPVTGAPHTGKMACATDGTACGGACDGTNRQGCAYPTTECRAASCDAPSGVATAKSNCAGGACPAAVTTNCAPFVCGLIQCNGNCVSDADCTTGNYCLAGRDCVTKLPRGEKCGGNNECQIALCVDGYCCDSACSGQCQACNVMGSLGTCTTVPSGPPHAPRNGCAGVAVCQGSCNGSSATVCGFPDKLTQCSSPSCTNGVSTTESVCNGTGSCSTIDTNPCLPYACGGLKCRTQCATTQDCAAGYQCLGVACVPVMMPDAGMAPDAANAPDGATADVTTTLDGGASSDVSVSETGKPVGDAATAKTDAGSGEIDVPAIPNSEYQGGCACGIAGRSTSLVGVWNLLALVGLAGAIARRRRGLVVAR